MPVAALSKLMSFVRQHGVGSLSAQAAGDGEASAIGRAFGQDSLSVSAPAANSVVHFDAGAPQVQGLLAQAGAHAPGVKATLMNDGTYLHYSTDGWKTSQDVPLQYLHDNRQGFLLRGVPENTTVDSAIHAKVGLSHNGFYSIDSTQQGWLDSWGDGAHLQTETNR